MSGSVLLQLQSAVRDVLQSDEALMMIATGIFDYVVPAGQPSPYLVLAEKTEKAFPTMGRAGLVTTLVVEVRSQAEGDLSLLMAYMRVKKLLEEQPLSMPGYAVLEQSVSLVKTALEADGLTRRAEVRLEVTAQQRDPAPPPPEEPEPEDPPVG